MHLNDVENAVPFFALGFLYTLSRPSALEARLVFGSFLASRLAHSVAHVALRRQPARFYAFAGGWLCNAFMAYRVARAFIV